MSGIGVMREGPLHAALKSLLAGPGDQLEVPVGGFVVDLVRADGELVEIQTGSFAPLARKLDALLDEHRMRIVHPVAAERRIVRVDEAGEVLGTRRSPRRGGVLDVFDKLVAFPSLLSHPHLVVEVMLLREDHLRGAEPIRERRRTRDPGQRRLLEVLDRSVLTGAADVRRVLPDGLGDSPFSVRDLALGAGCGRVLAQRIVYCLRAMGLATAEGRRGRTPMYRLVG